MNGQGNKRPRQRVASLSVAKVVITVLVTMSILGAVSVVRVSIARAPTVGLPPAGAASATGY